MEAQLAPGIRVEIRDAEWRIRRVDYSSDGGYVLSCGGLSELVQGRDGLFLNKLDRGCILDPKDTGLVDDTSNNFGASQHLKEGTVSKTFIDDTGSAGVPPALDPRPSWPLAGKMPAVLQDGRAPGANQRTVEYRAPFFNPDREQDFRIAWAFFEGENQRACRSAYA